MFILITINVKNAEVVWPKPIHVFCEAMNGLVTFGLAAFDNEKQGCFLLKDHVVSVHVFHINGGNKQTKCCEIKETIFYFDEKKNPCLCSFQLLQNST